ncbi:DUF2207 domain-containing protein [Candidatus Berkelbacteria bacterium]|nr:DUF2207 domain-containing protein [Candidatus Berkelbacteria bacterium]
MVSIGLYSRHLVFFLLIGVLAGAGVGYVRSQTSEAATRRIALVSTSVASLDIRLEDGGTTTVNGEKLPGLIVFNRERDIFNYQAYEADQSFIDELTTTITLPRPVSAELVIARHFATEGVSLSDPIVNDNRVIYKAQNLTPKSQYRLDLVLPKGVVKPNFWRQSVDSLRTLDPSVWLSLALGLPILALILFSAMLRKAVRGWRGPKIVEERNDLPAKVSPSIVGILVQGKVSPRSLAATLLDLAQRGYIQVIHRKDGFSFGKRRSIDHVGAPLLSSPTDLKPFERTLLDKIFLADVRSSTNEDIQMRLGRHIFSQKVAETYLAMYDEAVELGWFVRNPEAMYRRYRMLALLVVSIALIGFLTSLFFGPEPYFYLLGWAGLFFVGIVMQQVTPFLPRRTKQGDKEYQEWIKFRNFLVGSQPIEIAKNPNLYEEYLPYAVILGVEVEWTERFAQFKFNPPDWYASTGDIHLIEDFANNLFPIIGSVATDLAKAREPYAV